MNKIKSIILGGIAILTLAGCSDDTFNEFYDDPNGVTKAPCSTLMTGTFYDKDGRDYTFNAYWRVYTWDNIFGKYAQTCGYKNNSGGVYFYNDGYANDRWNAFYKRLAQFRNLQNVYENEDEAQQKNDRILVDLAEVFILDHATQIADLFGDTPFFNAGMLGVTDNFDGARPAYDDDVEIYRHAIKRLGELYTDIEAINNSKTELVTKTLTAQDYINKGDLTKWLAYANSLRLRLAVRVALKGDLTAEGQAAIKECMTRTLVEDADNQIEVASDLDGFNFWENFRDGYKDINNVASQPMIDAMQRVAGTDDPRLQTMYVKNAEGNYVGTNRTETNGEQTEKGSSFNGFGNKQKYEERYYSYLEPATFTGNRLFVSPIITAAEVWFLRAEAIQRGWATGDAEAAFKQGIVESTKWYYRQNNMFEAAADEIAGGVATHYTYPGDADVETYATALWATYSDKLEGILTQKWVNFGIIQPTQAWNDIRRTGYPVLSYPTDTQAQNMKELPNRMMYPNTEKANNRANYDAVVSVQGDDAYTKQFWAK